MDKKRLQELAGIRGLNEGLLGSESKWASLAEEVKELILQEASTQFDQLSKQKNNLTNGDYNQLVDQVTASFFEVVQHKIKKEFS